MYITSECSKLQAQLKGLESTQLLERHVRPFPPLLPAASAAAGLLATSTGPRFERSEDGHRFCSLFGMASRSEHKIVRKSLIIGGSMWSPLGRYTWRMEAPPPGGGCPGAFSVSRAQC